MQVWMLTGKKLALVIALCGVALVFMLTTLFFRADVVRTVADTEKLLPIYEVETTKPMVAISFDASWGAEYTEQILDTLEQYDVRATFFLVNIWIEKYPEMTREIVRRGQEIGLHSTSHPEFTSLTDEEIVAELAENATLIMQTSGYWPTLFRPPFGDYDTRVVFLVNRCGYDCVQWSVDSLDWKDLSAEAITARVTDGLHAGDIILLHNNGLHTAEALPAILDYLEENGLRAVAVSDLLLDGETYVDVNGIQRAK